MPTATSPQAHTILQLMLARRLFIGDEVRIATLRSAWTESGNPSEAFGEAISLLKQDGLIRVATSKSGPVAQLTKEGFSTGSQPRVERRKTETAADTAPPARRRRVEPLSSPALSDPLPTLHLPEPTPEAAPAASSTAATKVARTPLRVQTETSHEETAARNNVTHDSVFGTRKQRLAPEALQLCLLGMMRNRKMRPNAQINYDEILQEWLNIGLRHDDLLLAVKRLEERNEIRAISQPQEKLMLTKSGFERYEGAPKDLNDGMNRWQAKKLLRASKRLGAMPAA